MTKEEQIEYLTAQLKQDLEEVKQTREQLLATQEALQKAQERIAELEWRKTPELRFQGSTSLRAKAIPSSHVYGHASLCSYSFLKKRTLNYEQRFPPMPKPTRKNGFCSVHSYRYPKFLMQQFT